MVSDLSIDKLFEEIKKLRGEVSRMSDSVVDRARQQTAEAAARVRHAAEDGWADAKGAAADVAGRIEDQPLAATAIAFGVGILLGLLLTARRR